MLINSLSLKNFKCFEELDVKFAPITLLTGANSSGKSSLINAILAVLQTEQFPFYLSPNGKYVNMGSFEEIVLGRDFNKNVGIKFQILSRILGELNYDTTWENSPTGLPTLCNLQLNNRITNLAIRKNNNQYICNFTLSRDDSFFQYQSLVNSLKYLVPKKIRKNYLLPSYEESKISLSNDGLITLSDVHFSSLAEMTTDFLLPFLDAIRSAKMGGVGVHPFALTSLFNYVGSFRSPPDRTYYRKAKAESRINTSGDGYIDQIIEWEEMEQNKFSELNTIMKKLQLFDQIKSIDLKGGRFDINIKTKTSSRFASLTDVGFGISQFLPIIVADLQLSNKSCLAISQPEIHLHPKIQATFGNYLANQINETEKQYIVETHSEYLLNRIRLLLVTGELKPEDVRVLYFENDGIKSTVHDVEFATDGQIKGAPQGFFDTYGIDVMNIAMNAVA